MATQSKTKSWNLKEAILEAIGKGQSVINGLTKGAAQAELEVSRKNWILNGDMQVSQRGDYTTATATVDTGYFVDRWRNDEKTVSSTTQHTTVTLPDGTVTNGLKAVVTSGTTGRIGFTQHIEHDTQFEGVPITVSFWCRSNSKYANLNFYEDGFGATTENHIGDGNWQYMTLTVTGGYSISTMSLLIRTQTATGGDVTLAVGDYIEIAHVKLEIGDTATPFESRSYAEELALCQRYFHRIGGNSYVSAFAVGMAFSVSESYYSYQFPVTMRVSPTLSYNALPRVYKPSSSAQVTTFNADIVDTKHARLRADKTSYFTAGHAVWLEPNSVGDYFDFNAEL